VRIVAGIGSVVFAYLALVPGGLLLSTLDSACSGGTCGTGLGSDILLTVTYAATLLAIGGTSAALSLYAFRPTVSGERRIRRMLSASVVAVAVTLLVLFALAEPLAALVTGAIGGGTYAVLSGWARRLRRPPFDPSANGHGEMNGHPG
jgi:hypothetical protein